MADGQKIAAEPTNPLRKLILPKLTECNCGGEYGYRPTGELIHIPPKPSFNNKSKRSSELSKDVLSKVEQFQLERIARGESTYALFKQNEILAKAILQLAKKAEA